MHIDCISKWLHITFRVRFMQLFRLSLCSAFPLPLCLQLWNSECPWNSRNGRAKLQVLCQRKMQKFSFWIFYF